MSKDIDGKRNNHKHKPREEWVTVENGIPAIITKAEFEAVQKTMVGRMHTRKHSHAKEVYFLTGKMICSVCGSTYVGSRRKCGNNTVYAAYRCNRRDRTGAISCNNKEISRTYIEQWIIERLSSYVFSDKYVEKITNEYNRYIRNKNKTFDSQYNVTKARLKSLNADIDRTVSLLLQTTSNALAGKLEELEAEKTTASRFLLELERGYAQKTFTQEEVKVALDSVRTLLKEGTLETTKVLIQKFVDHVVVKPEVAIVQFNFFPDFTINLDIEKDCPLAERLTHVQGQSSSMGCDFGGTGATMREPRNSSLSASMSSSGMSSIRIGTFPPFSTMVNLSS